MIHSGRSPGQGAPKALRRRSLARGTRTWTPPPLPLIAADPAVEAWYGHIAHLARDIGARGSTTPAEAEAAEYVRAQLVQAGLQAETESFRSGVSAWWPFSLAMALVLAAVAIYPIAGRPSAGAAIAVVALTLGSAFLEVNLRWNPLRLLLPRRESRNVWAVAHPSGTARRRVAIIGHLDSHRTPLLFRSMGWQQVREILVPAGFAAMAVILVLFAAGIVVQAQAIFLIALVPAAVVALALLFTLQADLTPYTAGANDNATGAGLLPTLAASLGAQPLSQTEVWLVATGCEEVGCIGAIAFFERHRAELRDATILVVDTVGGAGSGPCYLRSEGMVMQHRYDPELLALADAVAAERPELGAYSRKMTEAYTEGLPAIQAGLHALTLCGFTPEGELPRWHQPSDTVEQIDRDVLARNYAFIQELLQRIDARAA